MAQAHVGRSTALTALCGVMCLAALTDALPHSPAPAQVPRACAQPLARQESRSQLVTLSCEGGAGTPAVGAQRLLTDMNDTQRRLYEVFGLDHYAPTR